MRVEVQGIQTGLTVCDDSPWNRGTRMEVYTRGKDVRGQSAGCGVILLAARPAML